MIMKLLRRDHFTSCKLFLFYTVCVCTYVYVHMCRHVHMCAYVFVGTCYLFLTGSLREISMQCV